VKILFTRFPLESTFGGAEVQTLSLMEGLMARGHAVAFLGSCPVLLEECEKRHIIAAELQIGDPPVTKWGAISFAWRKQKMAKILSAALNEFGDLDAICMLSMSEKLLLTKPATEKGIKVLWVEHDRIGRWLEKNPWLPKLLKASEHATTVAVSKLTRERYLELGWKPEYVVDIVNGVDAAHLESRIVNSESWDNETATQNSEFKIQNSALRLGCVARLSEDKGVSLLIEAMSDLPDVSLAIVGKGPEEQKLKAMVAAITKHEGKERITIEPKAESIGDFYRSIDALVLPSPLMDPCPLAPMEALWVGTPVILTSACGTAGYLEDGKEAMVVEPQSVSALREAVLAIQDDKHRKSLAAAGQKAAKEKFGMERMIEEYLLLLRAPRDRGDKRDK